MTTKTKRGGKSKTVNNLVIVSDIHVGCALGLCHPSGHARDEGGRYLPSTFQRKVWEWWAEFWRDVVPEVTNREPYAVVFNGDALEGVHHNAVTQWTHNLADQGRAAYDILEPVVDGCQGRYYHIRGTEAHVGSSAGDEERLARELGAIPNAEGNHARYDLWKMVGPRLVHCLHHIGATGSQAYEATAVHKELVEAFVEAGRWRERAPDVIVRSHRHRHLKTSIPTADGEAIAVVTPAWQGKTPHVWKIPGGRLSEPQFGGVIIRWSDVHQVLFVRGWVKSLSRPQPE